MHNGTTHKEQLDRLARTGFELERARQAFLDGFLETEDVEEWRRRSEAFDAAKAKWREEFDAWQRAKETERS